MNVTHHLARDFCQLRGGVIAVVTPEVKFSGVERFQCGHAGEPHHFLAHWTYAAFRLVKMTFPDGHGGKRISEIVKDTTQRVVTHCVPGSQRNFVIESRGMAKKPAASLLRRNAAREHLKG